MKNLNAERTNSSKNKKLSSIYSDENLREYLMRINKAATYRGNNDCEDVPIILREFIKGYENKIFELENRLKECENGYEGTLALERAKVKDLTEENIGLRAHLDVNDVIKALECCAAPVTECDECPVDKAKKDDCVCGVYVAGEALKVIKRFAEEVEVLRGVIQMLRGEVKDDTVDRR